MTNGKRWITLALASAAMLCTAQVSGGPSPVHFAKRSLPQSVLVPGSQLPLLLRYGGSTASGCRVIQIPVLAVTSIPEQIPMTWSAPCRTDLGISGRGVLTFKIGAISFKYEGVFVRGFIDGDARVTTTKGGVPTRFVAQFDGGCIAGSPRAHCRPFEIPYPGSFAINSMGVRPGERLHKITAAQSAQATANCVSVLKPDHSDDRYAETARMNAFSDTGQLASSLEIAIKQHQVDVDREPDNSRIGYDQCLRRARLPQVTAEDANDRAWEQQMLSQAGARTGTFGPVTPFAPQNAANTPVASAVPGPASASTATGSYTTDPRRATGGVSVTGGPDTTGASTVKSPVIGRKGGTSAGTSQQGSGIWRVTPSANNCISMGPVVVRPSPIRGGAALRGHDYRNTCAFPIIVFGMREGPAVYHLMWELKPGESAWDPFATVDGTLYSKLLSYIACRSDRHHGTDGNFDHKSVTCKEET